MNSIPYSIGKFDLQEIRTILNLPVTIKPVWAGKMAQQVKVLARKSYQLNLIPGSYMREGENQLLKVFL